MDSYSSYKIFDPHLKTALVFSGGGVRAAYQIGALKALEPLLKGKEPDVKIILGTSAGAVNALMAGACLKHGFENMTGQLEQIWSRRTFCNSFSDSRIKVFLKAITIAGIKCLAPESFSTETSLLNPSSLMSEVRCLLELNGGLIPGCRAHSLEYLGVMTTIEGRRRRPLLLLSSSDIMPLEQMKGAPFEVGYVRDLKAEHGFASAALPSVFPWIELDLAGGKIRLVDGGIFDNVPVDPAVRLGAERVIVLDSSSREWWSETSQRTRSRFLSWKERAECQTFCLLPSELVVLRCYSDLGPLLRQVLSSSKARLKRTFGPLWPIFSLVRHKFGEEAAYEAMACLVFEPEFITSLIDLGYTEACYSLNKHKRESKSSETADPGLKYLNRPYEESCLLH